MPFPSGTLIHAHSSSHPSHCSFNANPPPGGQVTVFRHIVIFRNLENTIIHNLYKCLKLNKLNIIINLIAQFHHVLGYLLTHCFP